MQLENARKTFFDNYVSILFLILSIVQGLAFQDLVQHARSLFPDALVADPTIWLYLLISFLILLRVLQTYITVGLTYRATYVNFYDIVVVFLVGILEAYIFMYLGLVDQGHRLTTNKPSFWFCTTALSLVGAVIYASNVSKVERLRDQFPSRVEVEQEKALQRINSIFMLLLAMLCVVARRRDVYEHPIWGFLLPALGCLVLLLTTAVSLARSFGIRPFALANHELKGPSLSTATTSRRQDLAVRRAATDDISQIAALLSQSPEFFSRILGVSFDRLVTVLSAILGEADGTHCLGYRQFLIIETVDRNIAGVAWCRVPRSWLPVGVIARFLRVIDILEKG